MVVHNAVMKTILRFLAGVFCLAGLSLAAAEPEWKAGLATLKITPEKPIPMSGYANRVQPFEGVEQDLFAKALALEDRTGQRAVIVTTDLAGITAAILDPVCQRITEKTGLKRDQILVNWSHTHSGPALRLKVDPTLGVSPETVQNAAAYTRWLQDNLVGLVEKSLKNLEPAKLSWGAGVAGFVMNRREFTPNGV